MSFKVTFIGAGSISFTRTLVRDLLAVPEFQNIQISFTDINERNLAMVKELVQRDIEHNGLDIKIEATADRRKLCEMRSMLLMLLESVAWRHLSRILRSARIRH